MRPTKKETSPTIRWSSWSNHNSASASEILSACLQDHDRAQIVGERTYGKGSVQSILDLEDGNSVLKLTIATYWRPSGKNIHRFKNAKESDEWGVTPNSGLEVKLNGREYRDWALARRDRDFLSSVNKPKEAKEGEEASKDFADKQLDKAVSVLSGQDSVGQDGRPMLLLAIETTCDETGAAVLEGPAPPLVGVPVIRSSVVASQISLHERFGGVVPEIAAREHTRQILPVIDEALRRAGVTINEIGAVAVATRPGLVGALVVGLTAAKALAMALGVPLIAVDHLEGHLYACQLAHPRSRGLPLCRPVRLGRPHQPVRLPGTDRSRTPGRDDR